MFRDFLRLFIPHICPLCNAPMLRYEKTICFVCKQELPKTDFHLFPGNNTLTQTFWGRTELKFAVAYLYYTKGLKTQKLLHLLKYKNRPEVGVEAGEIYGDILEESGIMKDVSCIIPVPLHKKKKRIRGYNQAEVFANGLSASLNIPVDTTSLQRIAFTETQTKKNRFARWKNVKEMFHLAHPENIEGKHVVLVDDVITTGSTLEACISELKKAENVTVSVIAIAVAAG
jgi:ComF family protein